MCIQILTQYEIQREYGLYFTGESGKTTDEANNAVKCCLPLFLEREQL